MLPSWEEKGIIIIIFFFLSSMTESPFDLRKQKLIYVS